MHEPRPAAMLDGEDEGGGLDLSWFADFLGELRQYWRLLLLLVPLALVGAAVAFLVLPRRYEADALIGPRGPSPTDAMLSSLGGNSATGVARRLLGGAQAAGADPYQEYLQLLPSTRLAQVLIDKYHLDRTIFSKQWDNESQTWKTSSLQPYKDEIKRMIGLPVSHGPTVDSMMKFFSANLTVTGVSDGMASSLIPGTSTYTQVGFKFDDPGQAEEILGTILKATDQIIREDQRRDVGARIAMLEKEIALVQNSDERSALIDVLTSQEQLQTMIESDYRYASTLVVPPYASKVADSPSIRGCVEMAILLAVLVWGGLIFLSRRFAAVATMTRRFKSAVPS